METKVHYQIHETLTRVIKMNQSMHTHTIDLPYIWYLHLHLRLLLPIDLFTSGLHTNSFTVSPLYHRFHTPRSPHPSWLAQLNKISWLTQIMNLLFMQIHQSPVASELLYQFPWHYSEDPHSILLRQSERRITIHVKTMDKIIFLSILTFIRVFPNSKQYDIFSGTKGMRYLWVKSTFKLFNIFI
jgi:hypothetical protein